jgi:hypothetical protein
MGHFLQAYSAFYNGIAGCQEMTKVTKVQLYSVVLKYFIVLVTVISSYAWYLALSISQFIQLTVDY